MQEILSHDGILILGAMLLLAIVSSAVRQARQRWELATIQKRTVVSLPR